MPESKGPRCIKSDMAEGALGGTLPSLRSQGMPFGPRGYIYKVPRPLGKGIGLFL